MKNKNITTLMLIALIALIGIGNGMNIHFTNPRSLEISEDTSFVLANVQIDNLNETQKQQLTQNLNAWIQDSRIITIIIHGEAEDSFPGQKVFFGYLELDGFEVNNYVIEKDLKHDIND